MCPKRTLCSIDIFEAVVERINISTLKISNNLVVMFVLAASWGAEMMAPEHFCQQITHTYMHAVAALSSYVIYVWCVCTARYQVLTQRVDGGPLASCFFGPGSDYSTQHLAYTRNLPLIHANLPPPPHNCINICTDRHTSFGNILISLKSRCAFIGVGCGGVVFTKRFKMSMLVQRLEGLNNSDTKRSRHFASWRCEYQKCCFLYMGGGDFTRSLAHTYTHAGQGGSYLAAV